MASNVAKIEENPYGETKPVRVNLPSVTPAPSRKQVEEIARERLKNEIEQRHSSRGRVLPKELVSRLEKNALKIYGESQETAMKNIKAAEKERGFELTGGQRMKEFREEYSFAVLREMDAYYRPEAEKRVGALVKTLSAEDRKALGKGKIHEGLVSQMARRLALNPSESLGAGQIKETLWAVGRMERALEELYGKERAWIPQEAQEKLKGRAMEIYALSRENAKKEAERIEKSGGSVSAGQKIILWDLEYKKLIQAEVKKISTA